MKSKAEELQTENHCSGVKACDICWATLTHNIELYVPVAIYDINDIPLLDFSLNLMLSLWQLKILSNNKTLNSLSFQLRKHISNKRLESITQLGLDRILDLQFGSGEVAFHIILELYDKGNIALTDHEYTILNILRPRGEGEDVRWVWFCMESHIVNFLCLSLSCQSDFPSIGFVSMKNIP